MIDRYTTKSGPAVSQKDLEKALHESDDTPVQVPDIKKMKARIEVIGDFEDLKKLVEILKGMAKRD